MRATRYLMPTLRDDPADAVAVSHRLLVRAGMARQVGAGLWTWLPLGWRSLQRAMQVVREEMDRIGGQEMLMPVLLPAEILKQSGRYGVDVLFKLNDRVGRDLVLAFTHEEIIAFHAARELRSWRDLPQIWYHIQTKERDEARPQGGVLRTREFIMKDSYTLDRDMDGLDASYALHEQAYGRIFDRCGLTYWKVESDTGDMGGTGAHEYMAPSTAGEDEVALCDRCDYAANVDMARSRISAPQFPPDGPPQEIETPKAETIESLAAFLGIDPRATAKAMPIVTNDGDVVLALVRGDRRLHELKLRKALGQAHRPATPEEIEQAFGARPGSIGPAAGVATIADETLRDGAYVGGANRTGYHVTNLVLGRDYQATTADLHVVEAGDGCPLCAGTLRIEPAIEIGNIFKLGTKYSEALGATYLDETGKERPIVMGSYGIGPARIVAAALEQSYDELGCVWPAAVAPFDAWLVPIGDEALVAAQRLEDQLVEQGLSVMIDDRPVGPGARFKDADLIGVPLRVTLGKRTVTDGTVDLRVRTSGAEETLPVGRAAARLAELSRELRAT
ncbi:MAG: proline--tRNA ligase [Gaiellales bacterium]